MYEANAWEMPYVNGAQEKARFLRSPFTESMPSHKTVEYVDE